MRSRYKIKAEIEDIEYKIRNLMEKSFLLAKELIEAKEREPDQITIGLLVFKHQELSYNSSYLCEEYKNLELVGYMANNKIAWVCRFHDDNNSSVIESDTLEGLKARIREFIQSKASELQTLTNKLNGVS